MNPIGDEAVVIHLGDRSYPVHIAPGLLSRTGKMIIERLPRARKCVVVTSPVIKELHGGTLLKSLRSSNIETDTILIPDGEAAKTWASAESLIGDMLELGMDRNSFVVAFGGGTIGDLAGFVASIYMRGVAVIQVPTTLLSMVDSSLGGKTAVNHQKGKNLIGAFHQPNIVISDINLLSSLPRNEMLSGLGEIVKHSVIADANLFQVLEDNVNNLLDFDAELLTDVVTKNVSIKAGYVEKDERDVYGVRAALNYGHTTGHALENLLGKKIKHGEAVAIGMCVASRISVNNGLMSEYDSTRQHRLLEDIGFNLNTPPLKSSLILQVMSRDKKAEDGEIKFVLPTGIGSRPVLRKVSEKEIFNALEAQGYG